MLKISINEDVSDVKLSELMDFVIKEVIPYLCPDIIPVF